MSEPVWTPEAEAAIAKAPFFVRPMARRAVEKAARAEGVQHIDLDYVTRVRQKVSGAPGGTDAPHA
ncbi:MAG: PCP reductase family protein [Nitrospirota bacterium]|nr:PCP reductase family protein [Nitrospirota bacterium]